MTTVTTLEDRMDQAFHLITQAVLLKEIEGDLWLEKSNSSWSQMYCMFRVMISSY